MKSGKREKELGESERKRDRTQIEEDQVREGEERAIKDFRERRRDCREKNIEGKSASERV